MRICNDYLCHWEAETQNDDVGTRKSKIENQPNLISSPIRRQRFVVAVEFTTFLWTRSFFIAYVRRKWNGNFGQGKKLRISAAGVDKWPAYL